MLGKRKITGIVILALLLVIAGCGGPATTTEPKQSESAASTTSGSADVTTAAPEKGEAVLKIGIKSEPDSTSPFIATLSAYELIQDNIYNYLIEYDDALHNVGGLAKAWSVDDTGLIWTFELHDDVKWHDGETFDADDVVWTYQTLIDGEYPQTVQMTGITKVEKTGDYQVKFYTEAPKADMEAIRVPVLPEHIYGEKSLEDLHTFAETLPVGTGPFKLVQWEQGQFLKFEVNDAYYRTPSQIDEIVYVIFANDDTLMQALIAGEVDAVSSVAVNQVSLLESDPNITVVKSQGRNFTELGFNCWDSKDSKGNPLILDWKIRNAISHAIDKEKIVKISLGGFGTPGTSLIPASVGDWHWDPGSEAHGYNPEKAKALLEAAGYVDTDDDGVREDAEGNPLQFRFAVISSYGEAYVHAATIIQRNLQDIGIGTQITTMDGGAQSDLIYEQNFDTDMYIWGWAAELDPSLKLSVLLTEQIKNRSDCYWSNEAYDALFAKQVHMVDRAERIQAVHEMQKIVYKEAPYIILYNKDSVEAYRNDKFEGWTRVPESIGSSVSQINRSSFMNLKLK